MAKIKEKTTRSKEKITRIAVFDFDKTLFLTPDREEALERYKQFTGIDWPHKGWWSREESLDTSMFSIPVIESVLADYQAEATKDNTLLVLLTGRIQRLSTHVEKILDIYNIKFDEYHYNNTHSTLDFKLSVLDDLLEYYPNATSIHCWEDRLEYMPHFLEWGEKQKINFKLTEVKPIIK